MNSSSRPPTSNLVSIIVLSYGQTEALRMCLEAIATSSYTNVEIIIGRFGFGGIDDLMPRTQAATTVLHLDESVGVAAARNELSMSAKGEYLAFLDDDTIPTAAWLTEALRVLSVSEKIGVVQSLLMNYSDPNKIEGAGSLVDISGYPLERGRLLGILEGRTEIQQPGINLFGACSAAMVVRRVVFQKVGGFDPDLVIELEDLDLSWRIRLAGYDIRLAEKSKVLHKRQSLNSTRPRQYREYRSYNGLKNQLLCIAKNMGGWTIVKYLPVISLAHVVKLFMPRGGVALMTAKAMFWNLRNIRPTLRKRYIIQHVLRQRPDREILAYVIRLPILLADIFVGTGPTLRTVRSIDEKQLRAVGER